MLEKIAFGLRATEDNEKFLLKNPNQSSLRFIVEQTIGPGYGNHPTQKPSQHLMLTDLYCAEKDEPLFSEALAMGGR